MTPTRRHLQRHKPALLLLALLVALLAGGAVASAQSNPNPHLDPGMRPDPERFSPLFVRFFSEAG